MQETVKLIADHGMTLVVCGLFVWQYFKQQSYNEEREEKLYTVIDTMSKTLPEIKGTLDGLVDDVKEMKYNGRAEH